ncbi:helix-turn-helix transcriptional regulator [Catellatospora sichuanensis]|uniref:helix-turn-helix transcriptional regulator n=1 Tax=Catellatospora sichuanensis TaxID=1969805 RepID=UPI001FEB1D6E|nr:LuxR family transcriptional regulator [Catellatospora sichuanensis]
MTWPANGLPLVGREDQIAGVAAALSAPASAGVLIAGPAGVGKTRLAKEIAGSWRSGRVLTVRCSVAGSGLALAALAGLLPVADSYDDEAGPVQRGLVGLRRLAGQTTALLSVDDAHLLDEISAAVIHRALNEGFITLLATMRTDEPIPQPVTALWKDAGVTRIELAPLSPVEMKTLLSAALGGPVEGQAARRLTEAAAGNPLFLRELVTSATEAGSLTNYNGLWCLTGPMTTLARLSELLQSRLAVAHPAERDALELLAAGEPLPLPVAVTVIEETVLEVLERRGLITVEPAEPPMVRLSHPLYGELLRAGTPVLGRRRHARVLAGAFEATGQLSDEDLMRTALWRLDGGGPVNPALAMAAARQAELSREFALAQRLAQGAYDQSGEVEAGLAAVRAMVQLGRIDEAIALCDRMTSSAREADLIQVVIQHAEILVHARDDVHAAQSLLTQAARAISDQRWLGQLNIYSLYLRAYQLDSTVVDEALAAFQRPGPAEVRLAASAAAGCAMLTAGRFAEAEAVVAQAAPLTLQHAGPSQMQSGGVGPTAALLRCYRPDPVAAQDMVLSGYQASLHPIRPVSQALHALTLAQIALFRGKAATAARWAHEAHLVARDVDMRPLRRWACAVHIQADAQLGRTVALDELAIYASGPQSLQLLDIEVARAIAWAGAADGDDGEGLAVLTEAVARHGRLGAVGTGTLGAMDLIRLGAADTATGLLAAYPPHPSWPLGATVVTFAHAAHTRDATALFQVAGQFAGHGMALHAAEAATLAGVAWSASGQPNGVARAQLFARTQLALIAEPVSTPALRRQGPVAQLTKREHDVALAAAKGEPTRAIAARLHLSERTVENHLHRAYGKLGITGRPELRGVLGLN